MPNVVFITVDQFRGDCLSLLGHPVVRTPNLDRLAARGVAFARHYSQAAPCGPGRAALYTGTYQSTNRVVFNGTPLSDSLDNVALVARRSGYDPTLFGYTDQAVDPRVVDDPGDPRLRTYEGVLPGFTCALDLTGKRDAWSDWVREAGYDIPDDPDAALATEGERPAEVGISTFLTDRFLSWSKDQDGPFFAHLSQLRPHPPYAAAGHWAEAYDPDSVDLPIATSHARHHLHELMLSMPMLTAPDSEEDIRQLRAQYYGMIGDVDAQIGRLLDDLEARGVADDTVIIVTADHGEQLGDHGLTQKMGWFESSYHIPCIVSDPRRPAAHGTVVDAFTENVDLLPTMCDLIGADIPYQCDGTSLVGFLDGAPPPLWRQAATWEFDWRALAIMMDDSVTEAGPRELERMSLAVRRSDDVAYVHFGDGTWLCYDLAGDPTWNTLIDDPRVVCGAAQDMLDWRVSHRDRTLSDTLLMGGVLGRDPRVVPAVRT